MPALLCTVLTHAGNTVYRTDTCRHCCVPSGICNPYLSSNVRCVLLQEPPAYAGSRQNCTHITAHKAHSLSLALLLCCPISTLTVHYPTVKFGSTRALLRCIRSHTGGTYWLPSPLLLLLLAVAVATVVSVQGPANNRLSHKTSDVRQTHCLLPSCSAWSKNINKAHYVTQYTVFCR